MYIKINQLASIYRNVTHKYWYRIYNQSSLRNDYRKYCARGVLGCRKLGKPWFSFYALNTGFI